MYSMSLEGEFSKQNEEIAPVLPVSSATSSSYSPPVDGEPAPTVTTVGEPGASLTQKLDTWQASNIPEEKTYFSCDVSNTLTWALLLCHMSLGYFVTLIASSPKL